MSRFDQCLKFVLEREGGYVNHPADRGGPTNKGIIQKVYDQYRSFRRLEQRSVQLITDDEVSDIYRANYWRAILADKLPPPVDLVVFDAAVNHGVRQASKFLQRALGVDDDGVIGDKTIRAMYVDAAAGLAKQVADNVIQQRQAFYQRLAATNPTQVVFLKGWGNRLLELEKQVEVA